MDGFICEEGAQGPTERLCRTERGDIPGIRLAASPRTVALKKNHQGAIYETLTCEFLFCCARYRPDAMWTSHSIPGLISPGPIYDPKGGAFEKAAIVTKSPSWGQAGPHSLKCARARSEEVRFLGRHHLRELKGHFSPGPQYLIPGGMGGATGNSVAACKRSLQVSSPAHGGRVTLSQAELGGYDHSSSTSMITLTPGSFADSNRVSNAAFHSKAMSAAYWRGATMLQPDEPNLTNSLPDPSETQRWKERPDALRGTKVQAELRETLTQRSRPLPIIPRRQSLDYLADPPFA